MEIKFRNKCDLLKSRLNILVDNIEKIKSEIVLDNLLKETKLKFKNGYNSDLQFDGIEEIDVFETGFTLVNGNKTFSKSYVICLKKDFHTIDLGLPYKEDSVSPHIDSAVNDLINKYNYEELKEIISIIDKYLLNIELDINYINNYNDISFYEYYYGEYNSGFDSKYKYYEISDVILDFKSL